MNKIKEFNSQKDASKQLKICYHSISKCCLGKQKTVGGFIFKYSTDNLIDNYSKLSNGKKIIQYDLEMNKIKEFTSQKDASKQLKICYPSISKCCLGKQKTVGGFIFKFIE
jgi:molybdenum-dependent DNA-binding transcriptional regulator ModE